MLSFLDAYSDYNQIPIAPSNMIKTTFITKGTNYYYKVMSFDLKNARTTYQRLMNKVLVQEIGKKQELVYFVSRTLQDPET